MIRGYTFALSVLNAKPWFGLKFCPCVLLCLVPVPSWCCYLPRVRVLCKLLTLPPELDHSVEQHFKFWREFILSLDSAHFAYASILWLSPLKPQYWLFLKNGRETKIWQLLLLNTVFSWMLAKSKFLTTAYKYRGKPFSLPRSWRV